MKYKLSLFLAVVSVFIFSGPVFAQDSSADDQIFKAKVVEVLEERFVELGEDRSVIQQNLKLVGLEGEKKKVEFEIQGISDLQILDQSQYEEGDKVLVSATKDGEGNEMFFVIDYVRTGALFWLMALFVAVVLLVGKKNGFRAVIVLFLTFLIILKFIIPKILAGSSPLLISTIGAVAIMFLAIFGTEGFNKKSKIAFYSVILSLVFILIFSILFTELTNLTGFADEDSLLLVGAIKGSINVKGLLLAGFIIGALGVLDDVIISQVSLVKKLVQRKELSKKEVFAQAMDVGTDHINAIVNTLFLAYAGASLPLLILFSINEPPFLGFTDVINNELIATEIVRTLVGSISLILAMPIATWLAVRGFFESDIA